MQTGDDNIIKLSNINSADWELKMTICIVYNPPGVLYHVYGFNGNKVFMACYTYIILTCTTE